jgi:hypothetical protein
MTNRELIALLEEWRGKGETAIDLNSRLAAGAQLELLKKDVRQRRREQRPSILRLTLSNNRLVDADLKYLEEFEEMQTLNLDTNEITDVGLEHLKGLDQLQALTLRRTKLAGKGLEHLKCMDKLERLNLWDSQITDVGLVHLKGLRKLQTLDLGHNRITDASAVVDMLHSLLQCQLHEIMLRGNPLKWPHMTAPISQAQLNTWKPRDVLVLLEALRDPKRRIELAVARIVMAAPSTNGKTHLSRWLTLPPGADETGLRKPIDEYERTWGFDRYVTTLTPAQHQQDGLGEVRLTVIDCGGQREQVRSHHNLVFMESVRTVFVVCIRKDKTFKDNWGDYYLRMIQDLRVVRRSQTAHRSLSVNDLSQRPNDPERIPVVLVVTHADRTAVLEELDEKRLGEHYKLLKISLVHRWNALQGDDIVELRKSIGVALRRVPGLIQTVNEGVLTINEHIEAQFELGKSMPVEAPLAVSSISVEEFRALCTTVGEADPEMQDYFISELHNMGSIVAHRSDDEAREVKRVFNPRFINQYLYRVLRDDETIKEGGFMTEEHFARMTVELETSEREALKELMADCLVTFEWKSGLYGQGFFVPDLLPILDTELTLPTANVRYHGTVGDFFPEHAFFYFLAYNKRLLKRDTRLFRNGCELANESCVAVLRVDAVERAIDLAVESKDEDAAREFVREILRKFEDTLGEGRKIQGVFEGSAFARLWAELDGEQVRQCRARAIVRHLAERQKLKKSFLSFTLGNMAVWAGVDEARRRNPEIVARDFVVHAAKLLVERNVIEALPESNRDYRLTSSVGVPLVMWVAQGHF